MTDENTDNQQPAWYIDDGIPGQGDRPSWLPEKFKSTADLAKAHSELEKKLGTAPENYDFTKSKFLDPDYVPFQELQQIGKEKRVPKEFVDKMIESIDKYMDEFTVDKNEELKKLGENANERVTVLDNWAKANLSKDSYEALTGSLKSAESIRALEELRGKMMSSNPQVPNNNGDVNTSNTVEDLKKELQQNVNKYRDDEAYRKDWQKRLEVAAKNNPGFVDKVGA